MNAASHIGQYRILGTIGAGGMGTVYLAEHILLGRRAAIKTLLPALSAYREIVDRFFTEARATSAITDHGVVQVFDFGYHVDGTAYIVMELLEGESLQVRIERLGKIAPSDALRIARQVAGSLAAAHAHAIVHRDLKPENICLIHDREAQGGERTKILDFGICKLGAPAGDAALTLTGMTMGTPVYMSPEQCRGAGHVDHRADIYALGCVLFHMLAGRPPFEGEGAGEFIVAHLQEAAPAPSTFVPELPELVDVLLARCLEKAPEDRFQSMTELQHALEHVLARIGSTSTVAPPVLPAIWAAGSKPPPAFANGSRPSEDAVRSGSSSRGEDRGRVTGVRRRPQRAAIALVLFGLGAALVATWMATRADGAAVATTSTSETTPTTISNTAGSRASDTATVNIAAGRAAIERMVDADNAGGTKVRKVKKPGKATRPRAKAWPSRAPTGAGRSR